MDYEEGIAMKFTVCYKLWNSPKPAREDWVCSDLKELMTHLRGQGVTKEAVDYLYVHYAVPNTKDVVECIAWENNTQGRKVVSLDQERIKREISQPAATEAPNIDKREAMIEAAVQRLDQKKKDKAKKPHIRLSVDPPKKPVHYSYLYRAQQV